MISDSIAGGREGLEDTEVEHNEEGNVGDNVSPIRFLDWGI